MLSFIARRLGLLIPTFFGVTLLTFALIRLIPGDPVEVMMGERRVDPQMHAEALHRLGLDVEEQGPQPRRQRGARSAMRSYPPPCLVSLLDDWGC